MSERPVSFGPGGGLLGVLSEPDQGSVRGAPAVLMWNVGMHHHVGPYRIYVDLARRLAADGLVGLRFDASGMGDSEVRQGDLSDLERSAADLGDAMALVESRTGIGRFVLVGFCSSVDAAHAVAMRDPRVAGVIFIEGYSYRSAGARLRWPARLLQPERWARWIARRLLRGAAAGETGDRQEIFQRDLPSRESFAADLSTLLDRGTALCFVHAGLDTPYQYQGQLYEMFGAHLRGRVEVQFYATADHTFFRVRDRLVVVGRLASFLRRSFGAKIAESQTVKAG